MDTWTDRAAFMLIDKEDDFWSVMHEEELSAIDKFYIARVQKLQDYIAERIKRK